MNEREHTMDNYCEPRMRNTEVVVKSSQSETYQDFLSVDSDAKKKKKNSSVFEICHDQVETLKRHMNKLILFLCLVFSQ